VKPLFAEGVPLAADAHVSGARRAALLLHAMTPLDRAWMLDSLPEAQRDQLASLLGELQALGFEADPSLIEEATAPVSGTLPVMAAAGDEDVAGVKPRPWEARLLALDRGEVLRLANAFRNEPAGVTADLLRSADFPWRQAFLATFEPARPREMEDLIGARDAIGAVAPRLRDALSQAALDVARAERTVPVDDRAAREPMALLHRVWPFARRRRSTRP
jgi:hypothetical protein